MSGARELRGKRIVYPLVGCLVVAVDATGVDLEKDTVGLYNDLAKISTIRLALVQADELKPFGATAVSLTPGWLRSEMMLEGFGVTEETWRDATAKEPGFRDLRVAAVRRACGRRPRRRPRRGPVER